MDLVPYFSSWSRLTVGLITSFWATALPVSLAEPPFTPSFQVECLPSPNPIWLSHCSWEPRALTSRHWGSWRGLAPNCVSNNRECVNYFIRHSVWNTFLNYVQSLQVSKKFYEVLIQLSYHETQNWNEMRKINLPSEETATFLPWVYANQSRKLFRNGGWVEAERRCLWSSQPYCCHMARLSAQSHTCEGWKCMQTEGEEGWGDGQRPALGPRERVWGTCITSWHQTHKKESFVQFRNHLLLSPTVTTATWSGQRSHHPAHLFPSHSGRDRAAGPRNPAQGDPQQAAAGVDSIYPLCDLGKGTCHLWASVSVSV